MVHRLAQKHHVAAGDEAVWSLIRVPGVGAEDRWQLHRELWALSSERNKHVNRIGGLLATQGISLSINGDLLEALNQVRACDGSPLSPHLMKRLLREYERLQLVEQQMKAIEKEQRQAIRNTDHPSVTMVRDLMRLKSIHIQSA